MVCVTLTIRDPRTTESVTGTVLGTTKKTGPTEGD